MNILFLSLEVFYSMQDSNIYTDLIQEFIHLGHVVCAVSPIERRYPGRTHLIKEKNSKLLRLRIGNIQKTNIIEKGISTLAIEGQYIHAIRKYFGHIKFDLVLYSTPPITFCNAVDYVKRRDGAKTYLLLKDIFPQNAVDMGMMPTRGPKSLLYRFFRSKEQKLYAISDKIGCMSPGNVRYLLDHNPAVSADRVEVSPNSIQILDKSLHSETRAKIREKYAIPQDKTVFVYGGNLGVPQGIPFLIQCLQTQKDNTGAFFLIVGDGTEYALLENFCQVQRPANVRLMRQLPKQDYDTLVAACDVGMIFLDHRFTIPNFPSRLLSYMQAKLPVLACTDPNTDLGTIITENHFGWWCESNDPQNFAATVSQVMSGLPGELGEAAFQFLQKNYNAADAAEAILTSIQTCN